MFTPFEKKHILIAHRGYRAYYPENTILAFEKSLEKFDMFEFDVQYTKDFEPIVFHDEYLGAKTNVKEKFNKDMKVSEVNYRDIKSLDNISWFIKENPFKIKIPKEVYNTSKNSIPHLDEVLEFIKDKKYYANLEIKSMGINENFIVTDILKRLKKFSLQKNIIISSFCHSYIKNIKGVYKALLFEHTIPSKKYIDEFSPDAVHLEKSLVNDSFIRLHNIINVYTVNENKEKFFEKGIKGLFCDY